MRRRTKILLAALLVVIAAGGGAFWWWIRDDSPPPPSLPDPAESSTPDGTVVEVDGIEGEWTVVSGQDPTFVGYRVDEVLAGLNSTAVGRTQAVTGSLVVTGTTVESASFTADLTKLASDESRRDNRLRSIGLEIDTFPEATFTLTAPVDLGSEPAVGVPFTVTATGDLTLHGVTQSVSIELEGQLQQDGTVVVVGTLPILFADYGIEKPDVAGFVTTEDNGSLELSLLFTEGA
jgi:polyisoprenoid-binding protein YceI